MAAIARSVTTPVVFSFDQSFDVRVVMRGDEPWFVAADVLATLSLDRKALERLDDDEKGVNSIHTPGGAQDMTVINESGLYSLILGSRKPEAKRFKKWVTSEVLPSIRKTGGYQIQPTEQPVVLDRINAEQARHLGHIVYLIKRSFVMEGSAAHASYALLRKRFGLETGIGSLPTIYYDQAIQILTELEKLAFAWKGIKIGVESKLIRNALRLGKPSDLSLYESMLTSEIEQLHQDHAHSLKLLAP